MRGIIQHECNARDGNLDARDVKSVSEKTGISLGRDHPEGIKVIQTPKCSRHRQVGGKPYTFERSSDAGAHGLQQYP